MSVYRAGWSLLVGATTVAGVLAAVLAVPHIAIVILGVVGAVTGALAHPFLAQRSLLDEATVSRSQSAGVLAVGVPAVVGLTAVLGLTGLVVLVLEMVAGWPLLVRRQRRSAKQPSRSRVFTPPPAWLPNVEPGNAGRACVVDETGTGSDLRHWPDGELYFAWRCSFVQLQRAVGDARSTVLVAEQRQRYLDEIERRDPAGFAVWMGSGARAASDPQRYLRVDP